MTEILPFRGIVYDTRSVKGEDVVAPPYDVITPELKEELYSKSPYNIVRIDFGKDLPEDSETENRYTRAARHLDEWMKAGILKETERPAFYLYEVTYSVGDERKVMRGLFGRVRITELCDGVYPHEATHSKPKADRLTLMHHCRANLSPIFSIYSSQRRGYLGLFERYLSTPPYMAAADRTGAEHRMWIIDDHDDVRVIEEELRGSPIYIADGHHRYETALAYQKEMKKENPGHTGTEPYNYVMMYLVNIADDGLTVLPTHRLVRELAEGDAPELLKPLERYFEVRPVDAGRDITAEIAAREHALGVALRGEDRSFILLYRGGDLSGVPGPLRGLDVTLLHELIFKKLYNVQGVDYEMDPRVCLSRVRDGSHQAAFFLNPTRVEDVERVASACLRMPPKSTYFFPKILTGFVINRLQ
ncbi:MAG: DUF1015 domain-containing protein [Nitrospirae bacterium]|nr:DUF1015 domain-containing protein [Nitrospirota bacterium]